MILEILLVYYILNLFTFQGNCPVCSVGAIVERTGPYGQFYGCSNFRTGTCRWSVSSRQFQLGLDPHSIQQEKLKYSKKIQSTEGVFSLYLTF
jgi:ssDNA-binding Zn-finger/Zn-ribbon topoisomerase 1